MGPPRTPRIDRAGADDVLQLAVDRGGRVPMVIGAVLTLNPHARPDPDVVRALLLGRAASVPRLRQRLVRTPPGAGRAVWLDAGSAAFAGCLDSVVVAGLAGERGDPRDLAARRALLDAVTVLALTRLPTDGPLWRGRLLLAPDGTVAALALVAHHVLADGMGGLAVLGALADPPAGAGPVTASLAPGPARPPERPPPWGPLVRDAWAGRLAGARGAGVAARHLAGGVDELGVRRPRLADRCSLLGATGDLRRLELATADLAAVRALAHAHGATVNDAVVAAVTGALVDLLTRRGEHVDELVVSVPVSRRRQGEAAALGNETGVVPVRVPAVPDRGRRLAALVGQQGRVRAPGRGGSAAVLTPAFRALAAVGAFQAFVDHQRLVHTFVTNVRGPAERLRVAGAEVTAVVPVALNPGNVAVSFDVLSYAGTLGVTLVCDPGLVPESHWLADRVTAGLTASG
ncbi:MAG TPA: WS/DGAT domain-containing protein [Ornithinibacter sp.]|nr:WS/DGAT domain-containing protein [Ornithinibacter sp.]